jgi:nitrate/nitrite transport system ATP-binding protein
MAILELRSVSKGFPTTFSTRRGRRVVLRDVNLAVDEGELVAILGPSGAGKTTLVSLIAGLAMPDGGTITLDGAPITGPGPDRGVVFQTYALLPWLTVRENVQLAVDAVAADRSKEWRRVHAEHWVRLVGLDAAIDKRPAALSGGMRQRVSVARGLATSPRLLLLDEPFSALDALTRATLQVELARIWQAERRTGVLITNDLDEAILLADRVLVLTGAGGATLGTPFVVDLPRPRSRRGLSRTPEYQRLRRDLLRALMADRRTVAA